MIEASVEWKEKLVLQRGEMSTEFETKGKTKGGARREDFHTEDEGSWLKFSSGARGRTDDISHFTMVDRVRKRLRVYEAPVNAIFTYPDEVGL
jgi:hypothetical protein